MRADAPPAGSAETRETDKAAAADSPASPGAAADSATDRPASAPRAAFARRQGDAVRLVFPFGTPTAAAVFRRADTLWLVFDTESAIDVGRLKQDAGPLVRDVVSSQGSEGQAVRVKLDRPYLTSAALDGSAWIVTLGESAQEPSAPLAIERVLVAPARAHAAIALENPRRVHRLTDPDSGDTLLVVTALGPARGLPKTQDFVEFRALRSTHGLVVEPFADDLTVEATPERVVIARPSGLLLTPTAGRSAAGSTFGPSRPAALDVLSWGYDRQADFHERQTALMTALSYAPEHKRNIARLDLARFYLARDLYAEAKGVLDVVIAAERDHDELARVLVLRAIASLMMGHADLALKDLAHPAIGNLHDAQLWRALALSRLGRFAEAREGLKNVEAASAALPIELQRFALKEAARCAVALGDFVAAARHLDDFDGIGAPNEMKGELAVLAGRVAEGLGRIDEALSAYTVAVASSHAPAAAEAWLRQTELRRTINQISREEATAELERLTTAWRGDDIELEALELLARLYTEGNRFRDALQVMRVAVAARPNSALTRRIQDDAAKTFESIFLGDRGSNLTPVEALGLFYEYRSLTPIGRRGDEMIRRLAERLIAMDLLKQASELLQHQIDHRLQGAARAQAAARLAMVYLMDRKPDRALAALRTTRMANLSNDLRRQRLLLEARALSETGRHSLALEIIEDMSGREVERLRADIHWAARNWRAAAEHIERLYGDRWRDFTPLDATERADILRAAIGYALAEDMIGLDRFRQKYMAKMAEGPDRRLFEVLTTPIGVRGAEFAEAARSASAIDTLDAFLRDMRARYPEQVEGVSARQQPGQG